MVYSAQNKFSEALTHFQTALAMNPRSKDAKAGLARLEKLMKVRLNKQSTYCWIRERSRCHLTMVPWFKLL
jgi:hypothetical protein